MVRGNDGHGNALYDGADGNVNCGTNTWKHNDFQTFNLACVVG